MNQQTIEIIIIAVCFSSSMFWMWICMRPRKYHLDTPCPECGGKLDFDAGTMATREDPGDDGDGLFCTNCWWLPEEGEIDEDMLNYQLDKRYREEADAIWKAEVEMEGLFE